MRSILAALLISSAFLVTSPLAQAQVTSPCESGFAGIYPCNNYDLVGLLDLNGLGGLGGANDIWGWTDPQDGTEYALVGLSGGTAFVDISSPTNPVLIGTLATATNSSTWRDVKVYADHAFIVSEASSHGMQVFDLTQLRSVVSPPITFSASANYTQWGNAHNIVINEQSGYAYGVGTNTYSGGLHFVDISNPLSPTLAGGFAQDGYTHDAQVVNYIGPDPDHQGAEIAFASNEDTFTIVDVTDKTDPNQLSRTGYAGSSYTHQGWATEDHRFYLMNDELDENSNGHNTRTYIWNIEDLDNPIVLGFYDSNNSAIDHNLYIKGNLAFQSNYASGLRVLDISDIANANLTEVGFFDVYPSNDNLSFNGTWSNYPYFNSGNIIVTSQSGGLFIVKESEPIIEHCTNGIQDADETGVDCGGADCQSCPEPCVGTEVQLTLNFDDYPGDISFEIRNDLGAVIESGGPYSGEPVNSTLILDFCLPYGCYEFEIFDSYGDGLCCNEGPGSYTLFDEFGNLLGTGAEFGSGESFPFCLSVPGPDCSLFDTAPVDLTKSLQPVPFPNGDIDRVQVKWYKDSPQIRYSAQDSSAVDIEFWAIRDLATNTPIVGADTSLIPQRTKTGQDLFKWPIKFIRPDVDPNTRYRWRVRTYCQEGAGPVSPWSAIKIFNTPDFDPSTGIYTPPGGQFGGQISKSMDTPNNNSLDIFPNPSNGNSLSFRFDQAPKSMLVEIFDLSGKKLYSREITTNSTDAVIQLNDLNVWQTGLYLVSVQTASGNFRKIWSVSTTE